MRSMTSTIGVSILMIPCTALGSPVTLIDDWTVTSSNDGEQQMIFSGETVSMTGSFAGDIFDTRTVRGDTFAGIPADNLLIWPARRSLSVSVSVLRSDPQHAVWYNSSRGPVAFSASSIEFELLTGIGTDTINPLGYLFTLTVEDAAGETFSASDRALNEGDVVFFDLAGLGAAVDTSAITRLQFGFDGTGFRSPDFTIGPIAATGLVPSPGGAAAVLGFAGLTATRRRSRRTL